MLNRHSKQFLRFLLKMTPDCDNNVISYEAIDEVSAEDIEKLFPTVIYLEKLGYLEISTINGIPWGVRITETGQHYFEFRFIAFREFLVKSVFVPIVVSVATTLIILCIEA